MIPYRVHSHYSIQNGYCDIDELIKQAAKHNCPAVALTDKNSLSGIVEFAQAIDKYNAKNKEHPIKGVFGLDLYVALGDTKGWVTLVYKAQKLSGILAMNLWEGTILII
jgi:DNA polymerase III alpha subunit